MKVVENLKSESGSAIAALLALLTLLTLLAGSFITASVVAKRLARRDLNRLQAWYLAESAVHKAMWLLSGNDGRDWRWRPENEMIDVLEQGEARVSVTERGGFLRIASSARFRNQRERLVATVGQSMPAAFSPAIIMGGEDFPVVVTGDTRIRGDVVVGESGLKPGSIRGTRYTGDELVQGRIYKVSPPTLPDFVNEVFHNSMARCEVYLDGLANPGILADAGPTSLAGRGVLVVDGILDETMLPDSVARRLRLILCHGFLQMRGDFKLSRPVTIIARDSIAVSGSVVLDDAVLYARYGVTFDGSVAGTIQALTLEHIRVRGSANLTAPSVLYTTGRISGRTYRGSIKVEGSARVAGTLILDEVLPDDQTQLRRETQVVIGPDAVVTGVVYSTNHTTIEGRLAGLVMADHFYLYQSPTTYINWLKDARIDRTKLPREFRLPLLFTESPTLSLLDLKQESENE